VQVPAGAGREGPSGGGDFTKTAGNHTLKFGVDVRRAYNLRVPSDRHRAGEMVFAPELTRGPSGGGSGLATFLLGLVGGNVALAGGRKECWRGETGFAR
jgi:hypothetical protein